MAYRESRATATLLDEVNDHAPNRSTISDGWIGDAAHATRTSDHNPWVKDSRGVGVVRARDFTHDPRGGLDCNWLSAKLVDAFQALHPATKSGAYIIWNGRILSRDRFKEGWRTYTGSNPHSHHLHISVATAASGYDSTKPWGIEKEDDMTPEQDRRLKAVEKDVDALREQVAAQGKRAEQFYTREARRDTKTRTQLLVLIKEGRVTAENVQAILDDAEA